MRPLRSAALALLGVVAVAGSATAQEAFAWSASAYTYLVPDDADYVLPILTGDRGALHLEGRYNYEALDAASTWIGYNLSTGRDVTLDFTPMVGGVFGSTTGIALAEVYDTTAPRVPPTPEAQLINLSARAAVGGGDDLVERGVDAAGGGVH